MRTTLLLFVAVGALAVGVLACSSNDTTPATTSDAGGGSDGSPDAVSEGGGDAGPTDAGPSIWPAITKGSGSTMAPMKLTTIVAGNDGDKTALFGFGDAVGASKWWSDISADYALGAFGTHSKFTGPDIIGASISDTAMVAYIRAAIVANGGTEPTAQAPDVHTLYLLYLPDGTNSSDTTSGEVNTDCASTTGYHTDDGNGLVWSVVERCPVGIAGWTKLQGVTQTAAHEIAEAATDPLTGTPTWDLICPMGKSVWECSPFATGTQGEVGDLCAETRWDEGGFVWSRIWGKGAAAAGGDPCLPKAATPYQTATTPNGWYTVAAGATATIPVKGWSPTGNAPDWKISANVSKSTMGVTFTVDFTATTLSDGQAVDLKVTAPAGAVSGNYAVIVLDSVPTTIGTSDPDHQWFVGVYVP